MLEISLMNIVNELQASMRRILDSLPDAFMASIIVAFVKTLSSFSPDEVYFGQFPEQLFKDSTISKYQEEFRNALAAAGRKMTEKNRSIEHPYTWLLPAKIPNSIAI